MSPLNFTLRIYMSDNVQIGIQSILRVDARNECIVYLRSLFMRTTNAKMLPFY